MKNIKIKPSKNLFLILFLSLFTLIVMPLTSACILNLTLINQDPYPAVPGDAVDLVFQLSGIENPGCAGAIIEVVPSYPFSIDGETTQSLAGNTWITYYKKEWMIHYRMIVDKNSFEGEPELEVKIGQENPDVSYFFPITVQDSRTSFDAVIQDSTSSEVSIAIANVGKYTANSVIVRIPEQDGYTASGTDGQMVGNLESGDYTLVGFTVSKKMTSPGNMTQGDMTQGQMPSSQTQTSSNLKFDIYYTDNIGERRVVNLELPLSTESNTSMANGFVGRPGQTSHWYSSWISWVIIVVILGIAYFLYRKFPKQIKGFLGKINLFKKKSSQENSHLTNKTPDWIKNSKEKERKK
ncbi:MAG: hypothetical protein WCX73_04965 [Candidatus Pacearchaeota archaeon]|jgi:hypothetical protein